MCANESHQTSRLEPGWQTVSVHPFCWKGSQRLRAGPAARAPGNPGLARLPEHGPRLVSLSRPRTPSSPRVRSCRKTQPDWPQLPPGCPHLLRSSAPAVVVAARGTGRSPLPWSSASLQAAGPQAGEVREDRSLQPRVTEPRGNRRPAPTAQVLATSGRGEDPPTGLLRGALPERGPTLGPAGRRELKS